jgi:hypothetical protein
MTDLTVPQTILAQLGGGRFLVMTGSYTLTGSDTALTLRLRRNKAGAGYLKITLTLMDTYTMEFTRVKRCRDGHQELVVLKKLEDVYCDQLQSIFTEVTGLDTHL